MTQRLYCGAGKGCITPPAQLLPWMFGLGSATFGSVDADLYVRVIALRSGAKKALIVSFDLDKAPYPEEYTAKLSGETGVPEEAILFFAIHTHTAPLVGYRPFEPKHDITKMAPEVQKAVREYEAIILERLLEAAREAVSSLRPAKVGLGLGESFINVNRSYRYVLKTEDTECVIEETGVNPEGEVDHTLTVLKFEDEEGKTIALFLNYPVHCVTMFQNDRGDGKSVISPDIGGTISQCLEDRYPGCVAVWSSGAAGDVNPILMTLTAYPDAITGEPVLDRIRNLETSRVFLRAMVGRHLADILKVLEHMTCRHSQVEIESGISRATVPAKDHVLWRSDEPDSETDYSVRLHLLRIGDIALIGVNGELFTSLGRAVQEASPLSHTIIVNHDASMLPDNPGYILDDPTAADCRGADIVKLPNSGFRAAPGTLKPALQAAVRELF